MFVSLLPRPNVLALQSGAPLKAIKAPISAPTARTPSSAATTRKQTSPRRMVMVPSASAANTQSSKPPSSDSPHAGAPTTDSVDRYVPRPELSAVPLIDHLLPMVYPTDGPEIGSFVARLALYIDEAGLVRRVEPEGDRIPAVLEEAARQAFLSARFVPGEIDGVVVKSLIRVEVNFESRQRDQ
jgi:periplasmic protein TonB